MGMLQYVHFIWLESPPYGCSVGRPEDIVSHGDKEYVGHRGASIAEKLSSGCSL